MTQYKAKSIINYARIAAALTIAAAIMITGCKPTVTADTTPPAEVTELKAVADDGKVTLSWKNPGDADLYQVEISAEPAAGSLSTPVCLDAAKGAEGSYTVTGLANGTAYTFTVKTIDKSLNKSKGVKTENPVTPQDTSDKTAPAEVTELGVTGGNGKISLSWKNPTDNDLYQVKISVAKKDSATAVKSVYIDAEAEKDGSTIVGDLEADTDYTVAVVTIDKSGNKSTGKSETVKTNPAGAVMSITLTQAPAQGTWTKEAVTVTVASSTSMNVAKWMKGAKSASEVLSSGNAITGNSFEVTENGMYSVAVLDNDGRREVETIVIKNIDKGLPQKPLNLIAEYKLSAEKIILRWVDPADTGSGVKELHLTYTVNGANPTTKTIAAGTQTFEVPNVKVQNPAESYAFTLKAVDKAGNEGKEEATVNITPTELAEVTGVTVSRKKIDKNDPDRKVTVTVTGSNLTKAVEIKITGNNGVGSVVCIPAIESEASAEFDLPGYERSYTFRVSVKRAGAASAVNVTGIEAKAQVCESAKITNMTVTKQDNSAFETDSYGDLKVAPNTGGEMKIVLTGTNLDIDGAKGGVNFNGHDYEGTVNENGTELTIQNIPVPMDLGAYPIKAQLKPRYTTDYTILPDSTWSSGYKSKRLRVLGDVVLKELWLSGYDRSLENNVGWLVIKGENLDSLLETDLSTITSSLGTVTNAKVTDCVTLEATYIIPDLPDDSVIGKTETLTVAGKPVSSPLHTLKIEKEKYDNKYVVNGYYSIPSGGNLRIPAYVDTIRNNAFISCTALTTIDLSATRITVIGDEAFANCTGLTSISFPKSLTRIGGVAFAGCTELTSIDFSATNLTEIGKGPFYNCTKFARINLSATKLTQIGDEIFAGCTELTSISFPQSLTKIYRNLFKDCIKLANAVFADTAGWAVYDDWNYKNKHADIAQSALQNPAKAAEYLRCSSSDTPRGYSDKSWKKN